MKKIAMAVMAAGVLASGAFAKNNIVIETDPADGMSNIFMPYTDVSKHINTGSCSYMTTITQGDGNRDRDSVTVAQRSNDTEHNSLSAMQHRFCQAQGDNGVSFVIDQANDKKFPSQISGLNVEFSKTLSKDSLKKLQKISIQTKENNAMLFLKWVVDRSMKNIGSDNVGSFYLNNENLDLGNAAVIAGYLIQDMINNNDSEALNNLLFAFEQDMNKGWNGKIRDSSVEKKIFTNPFWFSCEVQRDKNIKAVAEVQSEKIIEALKTYREDAKLYKELIEHKKENVLITKGNVSSFGLKYDDRILDAFNNPSSSIDNQTVIVEDPTLLWIAGKTYANVPDRCEQLTKADIGYKNHNFFFYDKTKVKKEKVERGLYLDPATKCQTVVNAYSFPRDEQRMKIIRGEDVSKWGYVVTGDGITPKNVFIELNNENQQKAMSECINISNNGFKIGKEVFKIKDRSEILKSESSEFAQITNELFPNGVWKGNDDGTCSQVDNQTLESIVNGLTNERVKHWINDLHKRALNEDWVLEKNKGFDARSAGTSTYTKDMFGGYTNYDSKDGLHWENIKTGSGKNDWKAIYYTPNKELCEAVIKDHGTLSSDDYRAKYFTKRQ
jgi:hypothetical protein